MNLMMHRSDAEAAKMNDSPILLSVLTADVCYGCVGGFMTSAADIRSPGSHRVSLIGYFLPLRKQIF